MACIFFFQAEDGIRDVAVTGVQTCALPISSLEAVLPFSAARFARAIVMPNLAPPVTSTEAALAYRGRILAALPPGARFEPLMTLYLTDATPAAEIERARASGCVLGCKLYPAGATTHSEAGGTEVRRIH